MNGELCESVILSDGEEILIRPIHADDKSLITAGFDRLSPETRYRRFFAPLDRLTEQDLRYLTEVDHHDHEALVGLDPKDGSIVGVARFIRSDDPLEAEVAVVVDDPWQGRGVASALLERLIERARDEGIDHFIALLLSENADAIELFRHIAPGGSWVRPSASGNTEMLIDIPEPGSFRGSKLARVLRETARSAPVVNPWRVFRLAIMRRPPKD